MPQVNRVRAESVKLERDAAPVAMQLKPSA
jgi:hypothetical protein